MKFVLKRLFFVFLVILIGFFYKYFISYAQKSASQSSQKDRMIVSGDEGFFKKGYTRFKGNAYVEKGSVRMFADVIEYFETNNLAIGKGNVFLKDSRSGLNVRGGYSEYYGNSNIIFFLENPYLVISNTNDITFLKGEVIILNQDDESVISETNGYMTNRSMEVFSDTIKIFSKSNIIRLIGNSKIISSNLNILSDRAVIFTYSNQITKQVEVKRYVGIGNILIVGSNFTLNSDRIVINFTNNDIYDYIAVGNVRISNESTFITSGYFRSVFSNKKDVLHIGMTNVVVSNLRNGEVMYSDNLLSDKEKNYEIFSGNVVYSLSDSRTKIRSQVAERFIDTKVVLLRKDVVLETENISIVSEMAKYDEVTKMLYMIGNPRVVSEDKLGVYANVITIDVERKSSKIQNGEYGYVLPGM